MCWHRLSGEGQTVPGSSQMLIPGAFKPGHEYPLETVWQVDTGVPGTLGLESVKDLCQMLILGTSIS